jgi:hypothetical protein
MLRDAKITFATQRASALGSFNFFHPLPEASVDRTIYRPCHCGVDFHYDTLKNKLCISLRFRRASPGDATIGSFFGLDPLLVVDPADNNNAPSDASSETTEEDVVDPATIHLVIGDLIGADGYLLEVHRVLSRVLSQ